MISHIDLEYFDVEEGGNVNRMHSYEHYQLRPEIINSSEVVGHKPISQYL